MTLEEIGNVTYFKNYFELRHDLIKLHKELSEVLELCDHTKNGRDLCSLACKEIAEIEIYTEAFKTYLSPADRQEIDWYKQNILEHYKKCREAEVN